MGLFFTTMSEHLLKLCGLTKDKVSAMMKKTDKHPSRNHKFLENRDKRIKCAYEAIKSGARIDKAAVVFCISVNEITLYAKKNKLIAPIDIPNAVPPCKSYKGWTMSMSIGVSAAAKKIGVSRRAIYSFAERYDLPTPCRV